MLAAACTDDDDPAPPAAPATTQAGPAMTPAPAEPEPTVPPATPPSISSEEIARAFVEATTAPDGAAATASLAANAEVAVAGLTDPADAEAWFAWNRAIGFVATATGCESTATGDVLCGYTYDSPWMRAAGIEPVAGSSMTFTISNGQITSVTERFEFGPFAPVWDGFKDWVRRSHPGKFDQILTSDDQPVLTPGALEMWQLYSDQYTDSFALEALGDRFLDAYLSLDAEQLEAVAGTASNLHEELYLQGYTATTNYIVMDRSCQATILRVRCTLVGTDDIGAALGGVMYTDTFRLDVVGDAVQSVDWSFDSTPLGVFDGYVDWLTTNRADLFEAGGPCAGFFDGGDTPGDCSLAWLAAVADYTASG